MVVPKGESATSRNGNDTEFPPSTSLAVLRCDRLVVDLSHLYLHNACMYAVENLKRYWLWSYHVRSKRRVCNKSKWQRYRISPFNKSRSLTMWPFSGRLVTSISSQCVHVRSRKLDAVLTVVISWSIQKESLQQVEMATIQYTPFHRAPSLMPWPSGLWYSSITISFTFHKSVLLFHKSTA